MKIQKIENMGEQEVVDISVSNFTYLSESGAISHNCSVCLSLWHDPINPKIPRLYRFSELRGGYCNMKHPEPTVGVSHPNCRHVLTVLMPGFGFDDSGNIVYKGQDWDEYAVRSKNYR